MVKIDQSAQRCLETAREYLLLAENAQGETRRDLLYCTKKYIDSAEIHEEASKLETANVSTRRRLINRLKFI